MESEIIGKEAELTVTWAASTTSNWLNVKGRSACLLLDLPAAFTGTALTYERKLADGTASPVHRYGAAVTDSVAGSTKCSNKLDVDALFGIGEFRIVSDQSETASGTLRITR